MFVSLPRRFDSAIIGLIAPIYFVALIPRKPQQQQA